MMIIDNTHANVDICNRSKRSLYTMVTVVNLKYYQYYKDNLKYLYFSFFLLIAPPKLKENTS